MFEDAGQPSQGEIAAAANRLTQEARKRGGRVHVKREETEENRSTILQMQFIAHSMPGAKHANMLLKRMLSSAQNHLG